MAHPTSWEVQISINETSSADPVVIMRRHEIGGPEGAVDLDIWPKSEPGLAAWLEQMNRISGSGLHPLIEPNGTVGGHPAVFYVMDPESHHSMITVLFSDGTHVY